MGLLDKLWDDTVAGPRPDNGLKKLRKYNTFGGSGARSSSGKESEGGNDFSDEGTRVTRSIMIVRVAAGSSTAGNGSPPQSPGGSTPPVSPFSGSGRETYRFRRRSTSDAAYAGESRSGIPSPPLDM